MLEKALRIYEQSGRQTMEAGRAVVVATGNLIGEITTWLGTYRRDDSGNRSWFVVYMADRFDFVDDESYPLTHMAFTTRGNGKRFRVLVPVDMLDTTHDEWEPVDTDMIVSLTNVIVKKKWRLDHE